MDRALNALRLSSVAARQSRVPLVALGILLVLSACVTTGASRSGWVSSSEQFAPETWILVGVAADASGLPELDARLAIALEETGLAAYSVDAGDTATAPTRESVIELGHRVGADVVLVSRIQAIDTQAVALKNAKRRKSANDLDEALSRMPEGGPSDEALGLEFSAELLSELYRFEDGRLVWSNTIRTRAASAGEVVLTRAVEKVIESLRRDGAVP